MIEDDDLVIIEALKDIKVAVATFDWELVAKAYNSITGEDLKILKPEKKKTKLERIREGLKETKPKVEIEIATPAKKNDQKSKNDLDLPQLDLVEKTTQDGANGKPLKIITTVFDEQEAQENKESARKKINIEISRRDTELDKLDNSNTEKDVRFSKDPKKKPPWN